MSKLASRIILSFTILVSFTAIAAAQTTHSVWSDKPLLVRDGATGASYNVFVKGNAAFAWTEATPRAYAHAVGVITAALTYDFMLISVTGSNADSISGRWIVRRNGVIVCNNCIGKAYGLSQPASAGKYFKIYIGTPAVYAERWHYAGYITSRFDF